MAHAFSPIPAKPAFGNITQTDYASDYIQNKIAKLAYCSDVKKANCKKKFSQSELLLFNKGRLLNSYAFGIGTSLINEANLVAGLYTESDLSGVAVLCDVSGDACINPTAIDSSNVPFYEHYLIDPDGQLFGNTPCGITNFTKYMTLPSISSILGPPIELDAFGGLRSVTLSWNSSMTNDNNIPITDYIIYSSSDNAAAYVGYDGWTTTNISSGNASTSMYPVNGLLNGTTYYFKVEAVGSLAEGGKVAFSEVVSATTLAVASLPGKPTYTQPVAGDSSIRLTWKAPLVPDGVSPITGYIIYYKSSDFDISSKASSNDINWVAHQTYPADGTSLAATITGLTNGHTYYFRLYSQNAVGNSINYDKTGGFTPYTYPDAPIFTTSSFSDGQITLNWTSPSSDGGSPINSYTINYIDNTTNPLVEFHGGLSAPNTSYTFGGLTNGHIYTFTIYALNAYASSMYNSNCTKIIQLNIPNPPINIDISLNSIAGDTQVQISWDPPAYNNSNSPISGYRIKYSTDNSTDNSNWTTKDVSLNDISNNASPPFCSTYISGLTPYTPYYFKMASVNDLYTGSYNSSTTPTTITTLMSAPTINVSSTTNDSVSLSWLPPNNNSDISDYSVQYSLDNLTWITFLHNPISPSLVYPDLLDFLDPYFQASQMVTDLSSITPYYFQVAAVNIINEAISIYGSISATTLPDPPTALTADPSNGSVTLFWTAPSNINDIYYGINYTTDDTSWNSVPDFSTSDTSYNITGLNNGTPYYFRVWSINSVYGTSSSFFDASATAANVPTAPTNVVASGNASQLSLSWSLSSSDGGSSITNYIVQYSTDNTDSFTTYNTILGSTMNIDIEQGLMHNQLYYFRVAAQNSAGTSNYCTTSTSIISPDLPTNVSATQETNSILLSWIPPVNYTDTITNYAIECYGNSGNNYTIPNSINNVNYSINMNMLDLYADKTYNFQVAAICGANVGNYSTTSDNCSITII